MSVLVPGYQLGDVLGQGGFATVYRALQVSVGREVAVKIDNQLPLGRWGQVVSSAVAGARIPGGTVTSWAANFTATGTLHIVFEVGDRYGSSKGVVTDDDGRICPPVDGRAAQVGRVRTAARRLLAGRGPSRP